MGIRSGPFAVIAVVLAALFAVPSAQATPPPNDNRADAQAIESFPAAIHGTLVEATVERLDPQVSECGPIASTVWYRIDTAPDGTLTVALRGAAGVAPVFRVYSRGGSTLREVTCGSAAPGGVATASFEPVRGGNYFVLVGRKPASTDGEFDLQVTLTLPPEPPANDKFAAARRLSHLPATVSGTTVGARSEENDPQGCDLAGATVWYRLKPVHDGLVVLKLHANGKLDAVIGFVGRTRSRLAGGTCRQTNAKGDATLPFNAARRTTYFVVVGQQEGSKPGTFSLTALAAGAPERLPGRALRSGVVHATLNGLTNVNDVWHTTLTPGTTYRLAFSSSGCATAELMRRTDRAVLLELSCNGYRTFTPGPDGGGMYVVQVLAAPNDRAQPYRLQLARTERDDVGVGLPIANQQVVRGRLDPSGVDVVDIYHFDVARTSDVSVDLHAPAGSSYHLALVDENGSRLATGSDRVRRTLGAGRYVVAVNAAPATRGGPYRLSLLVRDLTSTTLTAQAAELTLGGSITLRPVVAPSASGAVEVQIDRFDPLGGWQFAKLVRLSAGSSLTWTPPSAGTWRARAAYLGSTTASPSRSGYVIFKVR